MQNPGLKIIRSLRKDLKNSIDEKAKESFKRFFKEEVRFYGVRSADIGRISNKYWREVKNLQKPDIFGLCEILYKSDISEEAFIAASWADLPGKNFEKKDFKVFEKWVDKYINNWAKCDSLYNHAIGNFILTFPEFIKNLKSWARSKNRWVRRASAVTLIIPARRGMFLKDVFEISDILLLDDDDLVQKGYGWLLKEASRLHRKEVFDYVLKNSKVMPRTALRYAIEKMPQNLRQRAMQ